MNKPTGYDEVQVGEFTPAEVGGHHMIIKKVREEKSKSGKDMLVVAFDFAKNDKQPGYFADLFEKDIRPEKKWPAAGVAYIMTMDYQDPSKVSRNFKRFITSVEDSNGFEVSWGDKFCDQFKDKKVGGVFGQVEEEYNGKVSMRNKLRWFCDDKKADDAKVPDPKLLSGSSSGSAGGSDTSFNNVPDNGPEEIPF